jgi:N-acetylglucosaminyldiphosphoundecaprenol N-acetyl-beta-D-mannosaminyltransferase
VKVSDIEARRVAQTEAQHDPLVVPATAERRALDLGRDVHAVLGLVFDRVDLAGAAEHVRRCVAQRRPCFVSTPNVNFVAAAAHDAEFRGSVLRSDFSLADGFPIVRAARWMGIDLPGRVAGADLFERLQAADSSAQRPPIKLYLFGGPPGVAAQAAARLNARRGGFECVGHDEGGFGDVESMSDPATIERINRSGAEFVLVALGAKKGQAWIEHNRARLAAPVLCHLGAVINFAANSVARAPVWVQRRGLEWGWRIVQEPHLWRRYWDDGRLLLRSALTQLLPWSLRRMAGRVPRGAGHAAQFEARDESDGLTLVTLRGDWRRHEALLPLRHALATRLQQGRRVQFDLAAAPALGSGLLGLVALIDAWQVTPRALRAVSLTDRWLTSDLHAHGMQHLLD